MNYKEAAATAQAAIYSRGYYVGLYDRCLAEHEISAEDIEQRRCHDVDLIMLFNNFWILLPDSPKIRVYPFGLVCDIAEGIFNEGEE